MMKTQVILTPTNSQEILKKPYTRRLLPDESGGYTASIQEFPGLVAEGETADEALKNLDEAAESWLAVSLAHGREIKDPVSFEGCSGKIALRISRGLHRQAAELAEMEGTSLNQLLANAIAGYVAGKQVLNEVSKVLGAHMSAVNALQLESINLYFTTKSVAEVRTISTGHSQIAPMVIPYGALWKMVGETNNAVKEIAYG